MSHLAGEGQCEDGRLGSDRRIRVEFHGCKISSDGGLLLYHRELDDLLSLHTLMGKLFKDTRGARANGRQLARLQGDRTVPCGRCRMQTARR